MNESAEKVPELIQFRDLRLIFITYSNLDVARFPVQLIRKLQIQRKTSHSSEGLNPFRK